MSAWRPATPRDEANLTRFIDRFQCVCVWNGERCPNAATQEDALCDWCGTRRAEDLRDNPKAIFDPHTNEFLGLGGAGELHVDPTRTPDACWMLNSGRDLRRERDLLVDKLREEGSGR